MAIAEADALEILEPSAEVKLRTFGLKEKDTDFTFEQRPLTFFGKMDFFSVMGRALDMAMSGPDGISISDIMDMPETATELREADVFIRGVAKLASYSPEIIGDIFCVALAVPRGQRVFIKGLMELPEEAGGVSDEVGMDILETFVDQNWDVLVSFFTERVAQLGKKIQKKMPEKAEETPATESASSKPSKNTRRSTQKESTS